MSEKFGAVGNRVDIGDVTVVGEAARFWERPDFAALLKTVERRANCLDGKHEPEDLVLLGECDRGGWIQRIFAYYKRDGVSLPVCRHCRSLYVEGE